MTGNTSKWRAPLAGLASVAMLATMGVAASTANADTVAPGSPVDEGDDFNVGVYTTDAPYDFATNAFGRVDVYGTYKYGDTFDELAKGANPYTSKTDGKILTGYSYDLAGKNVASSDGIAVKGDTKLYAQSAKAYTVTFDTNGNGSKDSGDQQIEVAAGKSITSADYFGKSFGSYWAPSRGYDKITEPTAVKGYVFVGWTLSNNKDSEDLYTNQAIDKDTTLYPKFEKYTDFETAPGTAANQNVSVVELTRAQDGRNVKLYTLAGQAFPEFRADPQLKDAEWQSPLGTAYDFTKPVENSVRDYNDPDLSLTGVTTATDEAWTIVYHFNGTKDSTVKNVNPTNDGEKFDVTGGTGIVKKNTTVDGTAVQPGDPAVKGAQFTGWYQSNNNTPFDFSKTVSSQADAQAGSRTVDLYAGWDTENIVPVAYYYNYGTETDGQHDPSLPTYYRWQHSTTDLKDAKGNTVVWSNTGKALNYQTKGTAVQQPTGVEDYFQTAADRDHGTFTSRKVTGWNAVLSGVPVTSVTASVSVYAKWAGSDSIFLDANGGNWGSANHTQYVTKADGQRWADVVTTPTRSGYTFLFWAKSENAEAKSGDYANLFDGYYYEGFKKTGVKIADGDTLHAIWASTDNQTVYALHDQYGLNGFNVQDDYALYTKVGFTQASWKTYVDTWYSLQPEFFAMNSLKGQAKIDAAKALAAKYQAAQQELVRANAAEVPSGKVQVFRLFNPNTTGAGSHVYTVSTDEYAALANKGWRQEGVQFLTTTSKSATALYRVYNKNNGAHHYTTDASEKNSLVKKGWTDEGVAFYVDASAPASVYRAYNKNSGEHVYTIDENEYKQLTEKHGWDAENVAFKAWTK